ncbi:polysaccharide deacetylase family protein [Halorussus sp. GCM10023401]|uniref:polysaccharide deacetylase family protein n=1 Tax=Halorussus sp. GCM10023401 TaxID=3252680 RepID=UPI00360D0F8A
MESRTRRAFLRHLGVASAVGATTSAGVAADSRSGKVVFIYDDGPATDYDVFQIHRNENVPGCSAIISGKLGEDGWLAPSQLREMESAGWEIMSHTKRHRALSKVPLTADVQAGDERLPVKVSRHGAIPGDKLIVSDDDSEETVTVTGREESNGKSYLTLEEPLENEFRVDAGATEGYTENIVETGLRESKQTIEEMGISVSNIVMPYGRYGKFAQELAPQSYNAVANSSWGDGVNSFAELNPYQLSRRYFKPDSMTEDQLSDFLNTVSEQNALGILAGHTQYDTFSKDRVRTAIQMVKERDIEVVTLRQALIDAGVVETTIRTTTETTTIPRSTTSEGPKTTTNYTPTVVSNATGTPTRGGTVASITTTTSSDSTVPGFGILTGVAGISFGVLVKKLKKKW